MDLRASLDSGRKAGRAPRPYGLRQAAYWFSASGSPGYVPEVLFYMLRAVCLTRTKGRGGGRVVERDRRLGAGAWVRGGRSLGPGGPGPGLRVEAGGFFFLPAADNCFFLTHHSDLLLQVACSCRPVLFSISFLFPFLHVLTVLYHTPSSLLRDRYSHIYQTVLIKTPIY